MTFSKWYLCFVFVTFAVAIVGLGYTLVRAFQRKTILYVGRALRKRYDRGENPFGYWTTFGLYLFFLLMLVGCFWRIIAYAYGHRPA